MRAYKGFTSSLRSVMGDGIEKNCTFAPGATMEAPESKTARTGYHCCENPFECFAYYPLNGQNQFWEVEASGDIDEDSSERIACTKIALVKKLDLVGLTVAGMRYMIEHPQREKWQQDRINCIVKKNEAEATREGMIAIARGSRPKVRGVRGSVVGMILEKDGEIRAAKCLPLMNGKEKYAGKWITINEEWEVVTLEEKTGAKDEAAKA